MEKSQERILMLMLMDLVDHKLLTTEEAERAKRIYLNPDSPKEKKAEKHKAA